MNKQEKKIRKDLCTAIIKAKDYLSLRDEVLRIVDKIEEGEYQDEI